MWRRWDIPLNFLLAFIDELQKTRKIRILKKWEKIARDIIILHMCTKNHNYMRYSSWDMERDKFFDILGHFLPFRIPPSGAVIILNLCNKKCNQMMYAYTDTECDRHQFFVILGHFLLFTPLLTSNLKFGKNVKKTWRYYPFTHVHHKSRSYDVWFLRYKVQRTKFFVILGHFLPFDPPNNPKNQNSEKIKKNPGNIILHLCTTNDDHMYGS